MNKEQALQWMKERLLKAKKVPLQKNRVVIGGPIGVGKSSIIEKMIALFSTIKCCIEIVVKGLLKKYYEDVEKEDPNNPKPMLSSFIYQLTSLQCRLEQYICAKESDHTGLYLLDCDPFSDLRYAYSQIAAGRWTQDWIDLYTHTFDNIVRMYGLFARYEIILSDLDTICDNLISRVAKRKEKARNILENLGLGVPTLQERFDVEGTTIEEIKKEAELLVAGEDKISRAFMASHLQDNEDWAKLMMEVFPDRVKIHRYSGDNYIDPKNLL